MKKKKRIITIKPKGISQKQYSAFLLELNIMKREWRPYGVDEKSRHRIKKYFKMGNKRNDTTKKTR